MLEGEEERGLQVEHNLLFYIKGGVFFFLILEMTWFYSGYAKGF